MEKETTENKDYRQSVGSREAGPDGPARSLGSPGGRGGRMGRGRQLQHDLPLQDEVPHERVLTSGALLQPWELPASTSEPPLVKTSIWKHFQFKRPKKL